MNKASNDDLKWILLWKDPKLDPLKNEFKAFKTQLSLNVTEFLEFSELKAEIEGIFMENSQKVRVIVIICGSPDNIIQDLQAYSKVIFGVIIVNKTVLIYKEKLPTKEILILDRVYSWKGLLDSCQKIIKKYQPNSHYPLEDDIYKNSKSLVDNEKTTCMLEKSKSEKIDNHIFSENNSFDLPYLQSTYTQPKKTHSETIAAIPTNKPVYIVITETVIPDEIRKPPNTSSMISSPILQESSIEMIFSKQELNEIWSYLNFYFSKEEQDIITQEKINLALKKYSLTKKNQDFRNIIFELADCLVNNCPNKK